VFVEKHLTEVVWTPKHHTCGLYEKGKARR
jgi:hypothetical protein